MLLVTTCCMHTIASGIVILRDAEVEAAIDQISAPIAKAAGLNTRPEIRVIADQSPNAFTDGANRLFIHAGLLTQYPSPDVIRAVIAHEMGHIKAHHVFSQATKLNQITPTIISGALIASALNPMLGVVGALLGMHTASRDALKYLRMHETQADVLAMEFMERAGYSSIGLKTFLLGLNASQIHDPSKYEPGRGDRYDLTHPMHMERVWYVEEFLRKSKYTHVPDQVLPAYDRAIAKLKAVMEDTPDFSKLTPQAQHYGKAIFYARRSQKNQALDALKAFGGQDAFAYATWGEILVSFGDSKGLKYYKRAIALAPSQHLIFQEANCATIALAQSDREITAAIEQLQPTLVQDPHNVSVMQMLGYAHDKLGQRGIGMFYMGLAQYNMGQTQHAKATLKASLGLLDPHSTYATKANDLLKKL